MNNEVSRLIKEYFNTPHNKRDWSIIIPLINTEEVLKEILVFGHKRGNEMYEGALNLLCACEELVINLLENEWDSLSEEDKELLIHSVEWSPLQGNRKFYVLSKLVPLVKSRLVKANLIDALVNVEGISKEKLIKEIEFFTLCTEEDDYIRDYAKESIEELSREIEELIQERLIARQNKNYQKGDEIREYLLSKGIRLIDTKTNTTWIKKT